MLDRDQIKALKTLDDKLLRSLGQRYRGTRDQSGWRNQAIKRLVSSGRSARGDFTGLMTTARAKGLFDLNTTTVTWHDSDGESRRFTLARAASTEMWPMGTHYWTRDNAIIGARLLKSPHSNERSIGKALIVSALSFMSSVAQLGRFERIIRAKSEREIGNPNNWPHIFAAIKDNLNCDRTEAWAHQQDAWQILAWHTLDAIESGAIKLSELSDKHRRFFGMIVPFLAKVSFWKRPNSGSWEEIAAVRTSVRVWEHRLVVRLAELSASREWRFLSLNYTRYRRYLGGKFAHSSLGSAASHLDRLATKSIALDLPYESPGYKRSDPRFRQADSALFYILELDYVSFVAKRLGKSPKWERATELAITRQILKLQDLKSGGIARYSNDSYQRSGFFRNVTVERLNQMYGAPSGDASQHFTGRDLIVPKGRKAAWTHFVWQLSAWSARRYLSSSYPSSGASYYRKLHEKTFLQGLKLITGNELSLDIAKDGRTRLIKVAPWRMPECYISDRDSDGREIIIPSPHTPLNWAVAEMLSSFYSRAEILAKSRKA